MALSRDNPRSFILGDFEDYQVTAGVTIYAGAAVGQGSVNRARPLQAGDTFLGFAEHHVDNAGGDDGDAVVTVRTRGRVPLIVPGVAQIGARARVFASDDNTFTMVPDPGNSFIGTAVRLVETGVVVVEFNAHAASLHEYAT